MGISIRTILEGIDPARLAHLIEVEGEAWQEQNTDELRATWGAQLGVALDFSVMAAVPGLKVTGLGDPPCTIGELIRHPHPEEEWLVALKSYAHQHREHPSSPMPFRVAMLLYYLSIVLARLRCHTTISSLSAKDIVAGVRWALEQEWIDPASRQLFEEALRLPAEQK